MAVDIDAVGAWVDIGGEGHEGYSGLSARETRNVTKLARWRREKKSRRYSGGHQRLELATAARSNMAVRFPGAALGNTEMPCLGLGVFHELSGFIEKHE